jgi:hypothetical protein
MQYAHKGIKNLGGNSILNVLAAKAAPYKDSSVAMHTIELDFLSLLMSRLRSKIPMRAGPRPTNIPTQLLVAQASACAVLNFGVPEQRTG